jgi:hypothetical protein
MNSELKEFLPVIMLFAALAFLGKCNNNGGLQGNPPQGNMAPSYNPPTYYYNQNVPPGGPHVQYQNQYQYQQPPQQQYPQHQNRYHYRGY